MRYERSLDDLFHSQSHVRVLRALDELPPGLAVSARDLARRSGLSHPTASRVLRQLADQSIVRAGRAPQMGAFELNRSHVLAEKLTDMFRWERQLRAELLSFLRKEIRSRAKAVSAAYLFGSVTRNKMTLTSDIDLAVVCPPRKVGETEAAIQVVANAVWNRFGDRLNVIIGSEPVKKLRRRDGKGNRLWAGIFKEGLPVFGAEPIRPLRRVSADRLGHP